MNKHSRQFTHFTPAFSFRRFGIVKYLCNTHKRLNYGIDLRAQVAHFLSNNCRRHLSFNAVFLLKKRFFFYPLLICKKQI